MTIVIISHKDDLDGIISAALIKRIYMKDKKNNIKIFFKFRTNHNLNLWFDTSNHRIYLSCSLKKAQINWTF